MILCLLSGYEPVESQTDIAFSLIPHVAAYPTANKDRIIIQPQYNTSVTRAHVLLVSVTSLDLGMGGG